MKQDRVKQHGIEVLAIIPARSGPKGVPRKNLQPLAGRPLLAYTVEAALRAQVGEGDIDFPAIAVELDRLAPVVSFIPEIWQGHENSGEGFWVALNRLQKWF